MYIARRYFQMSIEEWDQSPWWYTASLIEGLKADGTLSDGSDPDGPAPQPTRGGTQTVDLSGSAPLPGGFQTRRVG